jgi:CDP-diacylglycerol--glycerol-3-phosphate 3-phosphatidyltransferase
LTDYFERIHNTIGSISYRVLPGPKELGGYVLDWPRLNQAPEPVEQPEEFKIAATSLIDSLLRPSADQKAPASGCCKTVVYPVGQFTPLLEPVDTSTEHPSLSAVLQMLSKEGAEGSKWIFTAGYFNIHPQLKALLMASKSSSGTVVTAAPEANGFYGSKGISSLLPPAYTLLSRRFLDDVVKSGKKDVIELREWKKGVHGQDHDAWTYHAKGLFYPIFFLGNYSSGNQVCG